MFLLFFTLGQIVHYWLFLTREDTHDFDFQLEDLKLWLCISTHTMANNCFYFFKYNWFVLICLLCMTLSCCCSLNSYSYVIINIWFLIQPRYIRNIIYSMRGAIHLYIKPNKGSPGAHSRRGSPFVTPRNSPRETRSSINVSLNALIPDMEKRETFFKTYNQ